MFRNARSLSGTYSTIINFSVADFIARSQKISILNRIKCDRSSEQDRNEHLSFPVHPKHKRDEYLSSVQMLDDIGQLDIEKIIPNAYNEAVELVERLQISRLLDEKEVFDLNSLSEYVFRKLNSSLKMLDYSTQTINDDNDEFDLDEEEQTEEESVNNDASDELTDDEQINLGTDNDQDDDYNVATIKTNFNDMKILDNVDISRRDCYFKLKINDS